MFNNLDDATSAALGRRYVAGIDGGGTKTACMIADTQGNVLSYALAAGSNHQIAGVLPAMENVCQSLAEACQQANIVMSQLAFIYLGMAGADSDEDFALLNDKFAAVFEGVPFRLVNDVWIAFACAARQDWGAVSICGTGHNLAVKDRDGCVYGVRALRYMLGNYGGGHHLAEIALHHAFRCDEHTGEKTRLTQHLPQFCGCQDMDELAQRIYKSGYLYSKEFNIPKLVFHLAQENDALCLEIIAKMGRELGEMLGRLICHAGLQHEAVPVVLAGSQYVKDKNSLMLRPLTQTLQAYVPGAQICMLQKPPVLGAVKLALQQLGVNTELCVSRIHA